MKMFSEASKWLIVVHLLLSEHALCMGQPLAQSGPLPRLAAHEARGGAGVQGSSAGDRSRSAERIVEVLRAKLQAQIQGHIHLRGNVSCGELLSASTLDDPLSSAFPRELLGVSLVPALVVAGCPREAQSLVLKLYQLLGTDDTQELLMDVQELMQRRMKATPSAPSASDGAGRHMEAVMFNIQQLAGLGEGKPGLKRRQHCEGWTRVNATTLVGAVVEGATGDLEEAVSTCEKLGVLCAGVTGTGTPGKYYAVVKRGSRILPSDSPEAESWIHQCSVEARRPRRSTPDGCVNKSEERVYNVMEWIPAVSTLYNLGTAVYYASVNCSETAKERAILSAVDLGTDALMVATGGTAGVAGYALGAGVKTGVKAGVKYLLNSMKDDDMLVNQSSWEDGVITIQ